MGHVIQLRREGVPASAPMFIPFLGAVVGMKKLPPDAAAEARVGLAGPVLGSIGAALCLPLYYATGNNLFRALAFTGFFLNLFNLAPIGFLDGGRIVTALSPWLWLVGLVVVGVLLLSHFNFLLLLILIMSLPRLFSLFRRRTPEEERYFEVTPEQRWTMAALYFGLAAFLVFAMHLTHIQP